MPADYDIEPAAAAEAEAASDYYEAQRTGLGAEFATEFRSCVERVRVSPRAHATFHGRHRRANLQRFPYYIVYDYDGATVIVEAVYHSARDPSALKNRLD